MIKVTVAQTKIQERKGDSKVTGKPYHLRIQDAYLHSVDGEGNQPPFPEKFEILLDSDQAPWAPGEYTLHPSAIFLNRDGRLSCAPRLTPIKRAA